MRTITLEDADLQLVRKALVRFESEHAAAMLTCPNESAEWLATVEKRIVAIRRKIETLEQAPEKGLIEALDDKLGQVKSKGLHDTLLTAFGHVREIAQNPRAYFQPAVDAALHDLELFGR